MIISAHLGDVIMIAADKRAMSYNTETSKLRVSHNNENKIRLWCRGAIAGTGDLVFINRVMDCFTKLPIENSGVNQIDIISEQLDKRLLEGVPKELLGTNSIIFSAFDGMDCSLYTIPISTFLEPNADIQSTANAQISKIEAGTVEVFSLNLPPDLVRLKEFQNRLRSLNSFDNETQFIMNYIDQLRGLFALQASVDPSVTPAFDLYLQSCETGRSIAMHVENNLLN